MKDSLKKVLSIPRYRRIFIGLSFAYIIIFLFSIRDLTPGGGSFGFTLGSFTSIFERTSFLMFEPLAMLQTPFFTLLISPLNIGIGLILSSLVGLNLVFSYIAYNQPKACDINKSAGVLSSLPALLAGSTCCAPVILLIIGIQASTTIITLTRWMIPISLVLLLITLKLVVSRTKIDQVTG